MNDVAIRVKDLGKRYRIGVRQERYKTLRDTLASAFTTPIRGLAALTRRGQGINGRHVPRFEEIWALKDICFEVNRGEVLGIIGPNGAGKSTLLKILSRITEPTEGVVDIYGRVASLLEVGTGFNQELTGRENIYLNGAILGMKRVEIERKFDEIVAFADVAKFIDTPVKHYSSGMYLRLAFAVAAHLEPEILIVDEVLSVGDAEFQRKCLGKMGEVAGQGRTVLFVSHNIGAINNMCSRAILIQNGVITANGYPHDVTRIYMSKISSQQSSVTFAPSTSQAHFQSLTLCDEEGESTTTFSDQRPILLKMQFVAKHSIPQLQASVSLVNSQGICLFYHSTGYAVPPLKIGVAGTYELSARIPGGLLASDTYSIDAALHIPNITLFDRQDHVLEFEVVNTNPMRNDFSSHDTGCIRVNLDWQVQLS